MKLMCIVLCILSFGLLNAQHTECSCSRNIDFMMAELQDLSPSYDIIDDKQTFIKRADSIKNIAQNDSNDYNCLKYVNMVLRPIQDGHLKVYPKRNVDFKDHKSVNEFLNSIKFTNSKIEALDVATVDRTATYYSYNDKITILIKEYEPNNYYGIVIESKSKFWRKGEVVLDFQKKANYFEGVRYSITKDPYFYRTQTLERLLKTFRVSKFPKEHLGIFNRTEEKLSIKILDNKILYVSIKSFKNNTKEENDEFQNFFSNIVLPNYKLYDKIIFDVRDNSGGAMAYTLFFKDLKKIKTKKTIYVLQNRQTASAGELFIIDLKKMTPITSFGENTAGMTAFRDLKAVHLPCYNYFLWKPIKKLNRKFRDYLKYEHNGIDADFELKENDNWLEKVVNELNNG